MASEQSTGQGVTVTVTDIAANLQSVAEIAWKVSIAAKNAKAIAARAGGVARGFQPITDYIDEIATKARGKVREINELALRVARTSVEEDRARNACERFAQVFRLSGDAPHIDSLNGAMEEVRRDLECHREEFESKRKELSEMLDEMVELMRAANSVASVCRIEAAMTDEYKGNLTGVADELTHAAELIRERVDTSITRLGAI